MDLRVIRSYKKLLLRLSLVTVFFSSVPTLSYAFDDVDTHPRMAEKATRVSNLDLILMNELDLADGINTRLKPLVGESQRIFELVRRGSILEDDPGCRASNHFHNPLQPFTSAGVTDLPFWIRARCALTEYNRNLSNVTWGTRFTAPTQKGPDTGNRMDWDAARGAYLAALTLRELAAREAALAETFQAIGQVMHLVQDLGVPAHVRNDFLSHLEYCSPKLAAFNRWCENTFVIRDVAK